MKKLSLTQLDREATNLRKRIFQMETLLSEKDAQAGKVIGPFKSGKALLRHIAPRKAS